MTSAPQRQSARSGADVAREWPILLVLAATQFVHILDFVIMMPLGPQFMRTLEITPQQFGFLVSIYTFSAAVCNFLGSFFIDRLDRRTAIVMLYIGFIFGTAACALAPNYSFLLIGRALAGAFGGLMGAVVFSIIGDMFAEHRRGAATGTVMSAFSVASVLGVPIGLWGAHLSWRVPFMGLAMISILMMVTAAQVLPPIRAHLISPRTETMREDLIFMLSNRNHWTAYALITSLMFAAFSVIPFLATYLVKNVGLTENELPYVYLVGGIFTLGTSRLVGRMADRFGKQRVFTVMATLSIFALLLMTNLPRVGLGVAIVSSTFFTVMISARAVPAMSMITSSVESRHRGSFMSFTSAIQQMASGFASLVGGMLLVEAAGGELLHFHWVGFIAVAATILSIFLANRLKIVGA